MVLLRVGAVELPARDSHLRPGARLRQTVVCRWSGAGACRRQGQRQALGERQSRTRTPVPRAILPAARLGDCLC
eukprot:11208458-Lingulodinium_polyedra.AAC.1